MKKLLLSYILCFSFCFMLFLYEPIMMYITNPNDFWLDLNIMLLPVLKIFLILIVSSLLLLTISYFIITKLFKNINIYYIFIILLFIAFIATYIQGNYLVGSLPILDGTLIDWNTYRANDILTVILWLILIVGAIILIKKYKIENVAKYSTYISLAIVVMLSVSLIMSYFSNKDILFKKNGIIFTSENINDISKDKNFFIFMLDSVDAKTFNEVLNESEYKDLFNDFTFYIDAMSTYPHTRDSVPLVLTGKMNRNEKTFANFSSDALNSSPLFLNLKNKKYNINLYSTDLIWNGKRNYQIQNLKTYKEASINLISFFKQELKYILFKYMPYNLKMFSRIETLNFDLCTEKFRWGNDIEYNNILDNPTLNKVDNNIFQFIHLEGGHVPFDLDKNFNRIENGTYEENC